MKFLFPVTLIASIVLGGLTGYWYGGFAGQIKPLGEIFINLIFTAIIPLIFFSVASAIAKMRTMQKIGKMAASMVFVFVIMGAVASLFAILVVKIFPPAQGISLHLSEPQSAEAVNLGNQIVSIFTVSDFSKLLSQQNILPLIIFSMLVGFAAASAKEKGAAFIEFLHAGEDVFMRVFSLIMYYAPIGFFAYFASLVNELGPKLMTTYLRVFVVYSVFGAIYFIVAFSFFAYLAGRMRGVKLFWANVLVPMTTAVATCSSAASIPANLAAAKVMRVPPEIYETAIPIGTMVHKDGSIIGGIFKIAFLFGLFHMDFTGVSVLLLALGVSLLVGTVMGAIPSGGLLGELLILSVYGFPPTALIAIAAISIVIDPIATMLNVTGNTVASLLIARFVKRN
jgi:Na+/H+-dicarboxylate symporter